jgi:hypothetical protein
LHSQIQGRNELNEPEARHLRQGFGGQGSRKLKAWSVKLEGENIFNSSFLIHNSLFGQ